MPTKKPRRRTVKSPPPSGGAQEPTDNIRSEVHKLFADIYERMKKANNGDEYVALREMFEAMFDLADKHGVADAIADRARRRQWAEVRGEDPDEAEWDD